MGSTSGAPPTAPAEREALSTTHWFETGPAGEPYEATVRFSGQRVGVRGKATAGDSFVKEERVAVVPGSGQISLTTWMYGLQPGEWNVTAELLRHDTRARATRPMDRRGHVRAQSLPRAAWSWRRWALANGPFGPVSTRWAPLVRLTRVPAVIPGSWSALVGLGVLVGVLLQAALLSRANVPVNVALAVDAVALLAGLAGAKLLYVGLERRPWRSSIGEGWSVDGFLVVTPVAAVALLLAFRVPIGPFFDASAPALFFGVAVGRLGCFFTGCCAGRCTRSRWGIWSSDRRVGARRIPTQLMESATALAIGAVALTLVLGNIGRSGAVFVAAAATYVLLRQLILRLRAEPHDLVRARLAAVAAALVLLGAIVAMLSVQP